jgi:uracil-DNA glycosylase family 4
VLSSPRSALFASSGTGQRELYPSAVGTPGYHRPMRSGPQRREELKRIYLEEARDCVRCPLSRTRTNVVFGAGDADANLMFVGEAPGANEDREGLPFVGRAGALLTELLAGIGMRREQVFITNTLMCRPPDNRDPTPGEIEACEDYLRRKIELIEPRVICTLGNFATKLLRGDPAGITRVHGQPEVRVIGTQAVRLYPLYHPAAALYTPAMLDTLKADFARIPELLELPVPEAPEPTDVPEPAFEEPQVAIAGSPAADPQQQLGLF